MDGYIYKMFEAMPSTSSIKSSEFSKLAYHGEVVASNSSFAVDKYKKDYPSLKDKTLFAFQHRKFNGFK
jgi:hypothetical protein